MSLQLDILSWRCCVYFPVGFDVFLKCFFLFCSQHVGRRAGRDRHSWQRVPEKGAHQLLRPTESHSWLSGNVGLWSILRVSHRAPLFLMHRCMLLWQETAILLLQWFDLAFFVVLYVVVVWIERCLWSCVWLALCACTGRKWYTVAIAEADAAPARSPRC